MGSFISAFRLGVACLVSVFAITGCGTKPPQPVTQPSSEVSFNDKHHGATTASPADSRQSQESHGSNSRADGSHLRSTNKAATGQTAFVPGTAYTAPVDDAAADGWQTEELSSAAGKYLKELVAHLPGSHKPPSKSLIEFVDSSVRFSMIRPADIREVYRDAALVVRRGVNEPNDKLGTEALGDSLTDLLQFVANPRDVHTKVKVFRVNQSADGVKTTSYMQTWGDCEEGTFQSNATWECDWKLEHGALQLASLEIRDYVEVVGQRSAGGGPMFADCTEAVLGNNTALEEQLLPSTDEWLLKTEIQYQVHIFGWQGVALADVNGDGLDDVYFSQGGGLPNKLFITQPDGTCVDRSAASNTDWLNETHGSTFADLDNDGDQDLIVGVHDGLLIMSNDGTGVFTMRAGQILPAAIPYSIVVADYDNDGLLDIFATCYDRRMGVNRERMFAKAIPYHDANNGGRNVLLRSRNTSGERWHFEYVTSKVGLDENNRRFSYAAAWEDYDNDGDLDLYIANDFGRNNLYRNDDGKFVDVAPEAGVEDVSAGMSVVWGDYNNDGWMDIYISNMFSSAGNRIAFQRKFQQDAADEAKEMFQRHARGNTLFENAKDGTFRDVSLDANVTLGRWAWGSKFLDLNNDGMQDILVSNGFLTQGDTGDL